METIAKFTITITKLASLDNDFQCSDVFHSITKQMTVYFHLALFMSTALCKYSIFQNLQMLLISK